MLTPAFDITQNDQFLTINIKAPYTKVSEAEIFFAESEFRFYSSPYFLRLYLPGQVVENGEESAKYEADSGSFIIKVPKLQPGEFFEGLDLQTKLLATKKATTGPLIEVLGDVGSNCEETEDEISWEVLQNPYTQEDLIPNFKYGFANEKSGVFTRLEEEIPDLIDLRDPDCKSITDRREERIATENRDFSPDHYLADLYELDDEIEQFIKYKPEWTKSDGENKANLDSSDKEKMRKLPRKEYLLSPESKQSVLLGLVDILFAYAYNVRTTEGLDTVESSWTITKLSSTLSWLQTESDLKSVLISSIRRSLSYPLYRNFKLAQIIVRDTFDILSLGTNMVVKCFLHIQRIFDSNKPYYVHNDLYITDYCVWVQTVSNETFTKMAENLSKIALSKYDPDLELTELEQAAELVFKENETRSNDLVQQMSGLHVGDKDETDSDDYVTSSDSDSSSSDDETDDDSSSADSTQNNNKG